MAESKDARALLRAWLVTGSTPQPADGAEADGLVAEAREQGLAGLLHAALPPRDGGWPEAAREGLKAAYQGLVFRGVQQLESAARALAILSRRGLRALPLKGAALAERLYDSVGHRPMSDVDLLALDDWPASRRALVEAGYRHRERADHAWICVDPLSGVIVELHHDVTSCPGFHPVDAEGLWARSLPAEGQVTRIPSWEDLLIHLCLHASFQHGLALSLVQYLDLRRLLERTSLEPERLQEIAAPARAEAAVGLALEAAAAIVGAPVPPAVREAFAPRVPRRLGRWLRDRLRDPLSLVAPGAPALARVRWELGAGRRLELLRRTLAPADPGEAAGLLPRGRRLVARAVQLGSRYGPLAGIAGGEGSDA